MMRTAFAVAFAGFAAAATPEGQATLAPKGEELKELLALDSFNVTSSDAEQNRMHAVCDMEYRLSNKMGSKKGLGITNLVATSPQLPFNPFTMPLAAVKAHIALLEQQKTYLEAQSAAFGGTATASSSSTSMITVSALARIATAATTDAIITAADASTAAATDTFKLSFTSEIIPKDHSIYFTLIGATDAAILAASATVTPYTTGTIAPCYDKRGTDSTSDDGQCKLEDGTTAFADDLAYSQTETAATSGKLVVSTSTAQTGGTFTNTDASSWTTGALSFTTTASDTANVKALRFMYKTGTAQGLRAVTGGSWFVPYGVVANFGTTVVGHKVTMEVLDSTGTIVASGDASSTL